MLSYNMRFFLKVKSYYMNIKPSVKAILACSSCVVSEFVCLCLTNRAYDKLISSCGQKTNSSFKGRMPETRRVAPCLGTPCPPLRLLIVYFLSTWCYENTRKMYSSLMMRSINFLHQVIETQILPINNNLTLNLYTNLLGTSDH